MARHRPHERKPKFDDDDDAPTQNDASPSPSEPAKLNSLITSRLNSMLPTLPPDGPPRGDDEAKRAFYQDLVRLKEQRYSHRECALALNVSERSIVNYIADPLYKEIQAELIADAKQRGHLLISEMIDPALSTLYELVQPHPKVSPFVRFKAAEALLNYAGYNMPREEAHTDAREGLARFLQEVEARKQQTPQTIVQVNVSGNSELPQNTNVVNSTNFLEDHPYEETIKEKEARVVPSNPYQQTVLPGGKLPPLPFVPTSPPDPEKEAG